MSKINKIKLFFRYPLHYGAIRIFGKFDSVINILKHKLYILFTRIQLIYLSFRCRKFKYDKGIIFYGRTIFSVDNKAKVNLGSNIIFNNSIKSNLAGLFKRTSIEVLRGATLTMKNNCGVSGASIYCKKSITIGENSLIGVNCMIWDTDFHQLSSTDRLNNNTDAVISREIIIGNNVFIGGNSIILKGTRIGDGSVISAGSVVSGRVPKNQVWGGNPAKFLYSIAFEKT